MSDYWSVINEAVPTLLNQKDRFHKNVRYLILYTEFFKTGLILDTFELSKKIDSFRDYKEIIEYLQKEAPRSILNNVKKSYAKRFFYTQAGYYKDLKGYSAQKILYELTHEVTKNIANG